MKTRSRSGKSTHVGMDMYTARVVGSRRLSPHVIRVTFGAPELRGFRDDGPDQRFKLMLPRPGQAAPLLPGSEHWFEEWLAMSPDERPIMRTYTIRAARPARGEVDVDMLVHEDGGPGSRFARTAAPGDTVGIQGAFAEYEPSAPTDVQLLAGDLSALPALAAISERSRPQHIVIELLDMADAAAFDADGVDRVQWVRGDPAHPGRALLEAVQDLPPVPRGAYAWFAGEQSMVADLRRHAVRVRGLRPTNVMFMGYWRRGGPLDPA